MSAAFGPGVCDCCNQRRASVRMYPTDDDNEVAILCDDCAEALVIDGDETESSP